MYFNSATIPSLYLCSLIPLTGRSSPSQAKHRRSLKSNLKRNSIGNLKGSQTFVGSPMVELVEVVVAGGPTVGWVSVASLEWVLGQWICCLGFFFIFFYGRLWVASGGGGGGGVRCV